MAIPAGICVAWPSTAASIPSGWTRETALDSRYILGAGTVQDTDLLTDRGNTTHTHTSPGHTPTQNPHTHTFHVDSNTADNSLIDGAGGGNVPAFTHGHTAPATSTAVTGINNSATITVDAASNDLAYKEVIWIKSDGTPAALPLGCYVFFESDSLPSGWARVVGDTYLKGAGSGSDGGATGGSNTHSHTSPAHTHTQQAHSHTGVSSGGDSALLGKGIGSPIATVGHTHNVSMLGATATNQAVTTTVDAGDGQPPFKKLNIVQTTVSIPANVIALWLGTNANIPSGWTRYTAMDNKWLKGASADGQSGVSTGGGSQHSHTASDCQPTQDAHSHSAVDTSTNGSTTAASGSNTTVADHSHSPWDVDAEAATNNAVAVTIDLCTSNAALPKHRTVIYVQFTGVTPPPTPGGVLTVYETGLFETGVNRENVGPKLTPEQEYAIWHGDIRYYPGLLPGGPPR